MLKTNLKLAFRNIFRNKLYTTINIIGLSVASAFCILVFLYVKSEHSFDRFHLDQDRLFRLETNDNSPANDADKPKKNFFSFMMKDAEQNNLLVTPPVLAIDLKRTFPEIESAVRLMGFYNPIVRVGNQSFREKDNVTYADEDFFKVFNYPLVVGNPLTALSANGRIVISERLAEKYFGKENPIGRTISVPNKNNSLFTVGAVMKNFPVNSSFQYDIIVPLKSDPDYNERISTGLNTYSDPLFLKFKKGTDVANFKRKLDVFAKTYFNSGLETAQSRDPKNKIQETHVFLRPFADAHYNQSTPWNHYTDLKNIYQLVCLTVVILLIACLNYILLTLTSAVSRSQDVGIRKTIGADRKQIVFKYYIETQLLAFIAVIAGLLLAVICMPFFNNLTGAVLSLSAFSFGSIALMLSVLALALGLLAGIYPAVAMSGLKPLNIMRSFSAYKINPFLSKSLVVVQFTICVILVISALAINKQMHFVNSMDMGFRKDLVLRVENPYGWQDAQKAAALKNQLYNYTKTNPALLGMTGTSFSFGAHSTNNFFINGEKNMVQFLNVDYNYFSFNKIKIVTGRDFSKEIASDSAKIIIPDLEKSHKGSLARHTIIVNETLYNMLGKPELGIINRVMGGIIIGVCKDYHTDDLTKKIAPAYHTVNYGSLYSYYIRIKPGQRIPKVMDDIKATWNNLTGNLPFTYTFLDEDVAKSYEAYLRWMTTITTSCILAIIIACLGLFGLSGLNTINRTKEIGIRKVLGASVSNLFLLLNRGTLIIATGSFIVAAPVAWYLVHQWLDNFAYRITPDWGLFITAGIIAMITAIIAVSYHTVKAAISNPVKSLRSE